MDIALQNDSRELSCVLIPSGNYQLLLPNVSVAEILPWRRIKPLEDTPNWCLGLLGWRGESLPVLRFELVAAEVGDAPRTGRCLVVMNRSHSVRSLPFWALAADGLPRMLSLDSEDVNESARTPVATESACVMLGTEEVSIPNLGYLEERVSSLPGLSG